MTDNKPLLIQVHIKTGATDVFRALTTKAALEAWLADNADVDLAAGRFLCWGKATPDNPAAHDDHMQLLDYKPDRLIKFAWSIGGNTGTATIGLHGTSASETVLSLIHRRAPGDQPESFALEDYWFLHLENLRRFLDGKSCEARIDFSTAMTGNICHVLDSTATKERLYAVLTEPRWMQRWIASRARVDLRVGGVYDLGWGVDGIKVVDFAQNQGLSISWQEADEEPTLASWQLEDCAGMTRITFEHSGFNLDYANNGIWVGWLNFLNWIRSVAEYGADWHPPAIPLGDHPWAHIYPLSMHEVQETLLQSELQALSCSPNS